MRLLSALLLALTLACTGPALKPLARPSPNHSRPAVSPSPPIASASGPIEEFVPEAVRFVEDHRGLKFKEPVRVDHLSDEEFNRRIIDLQRRDRGDTDRLGRILQALGLVGKEADVEQQEESLLVAGVIGYYDPKSRELVVRGEAATPNVRHVVVHELTHALQDQWFTLELGTQVSDDASLAYTALVEGDARRIETQYIRSLPVSDQRAIAAAGGGTPPDVSRVLVELLAFPYQAGPPFIEAVVSARGQDGLDRAFRERPGATAYILHPDRYLAGENIRQVTAPQADGPAFDSGSIGEVGLLLLLEGTASAGAAGVADLRSATQGWAGDRYVAWSSGGLYCLRVRFATRTGDDRGHLIAALQRFASARASASVQDGDQPMLTSCG